MSNNKDGDIYNENNQNDSTDAATIVFTSSSDESISGAEEVVDTKIISKHLAKTKISVPIDEKPLNSTPIDSSPLLIMEGYQDQSLEDYETANSGLNSPDVTIQSNRQSPKKHSCDDVISSASSEETYGNKSGHLRIGGSVVSSPYISTTTTKMCHLNYDMKGEDCLRLLADNDYPNYMTDNKITLLPEVDFETGITIETGRHDSRESQPLLGGPSCSGVGGSRHDHLDGSSNIFPGK